MQVAKSKRGTLKNPIDVLAARLERFMARIKGPFTFGRTRPLA
jgi:hypothetical protein